MPECQLLVRTQYFNIRNRELGSLHAAQGAAYGVELAIGEDVAINEFGGRRLVPVLHLVGDPVVRNPPAVLQQRVPYGFVVLLSHAAARFSTLVACLGAFLAVVHLMLGALVATGLANVGAQGANGFGVLTATGHRRCGKCANSGAVHVYRNALCHHFDVCFMQA